MALSRRNLLQLSGLAVASAFVRNSAAADDAKSPAPSATLTRRERSAGEPFGYCLNTSTIRGQKLGLLEELEIASAVGFDAVEPWINEIVKYKEEGGSLADLKKRIADLGLTVESAIGFTNWIVDDDAERAKGVEATKRDMDLVAQIGGTRIAAPPSGATTKAGLDLRKAAERYRTILELGDKMGVIPQVELWGFSQNLNRLGDVLFIAAEARHPQACVLLDIYHLYKGGSEFAGLHLVSGTGMHVIHANDYPNIPREKINDSDRVYPGDGVAPLGQIFRDLSAAGFRGFLSLELFNKDYYTRDAKEVARMGLEKMKLQVRAALAEKPAEPR